MPTLSPEPFEAGQAVYTRPVLAVYDLFVLGLSNRFIWRCPTRHILDLYEAHVSANHLDVGVGTGFFPDRCRFPSSPRLVLMDLNPNCLEAAGARTQRYRPALSHRNVLESIDWTDEPFDSIGINYLLHCLPGPLEAKACVFDHLLPLLRPGGIIFGSTLLSHGVERSFLARRLMAVYNRKGIFSNEGDSLEGLKRTLEERFIQIALDVKGCACLFSARRP